MASDGGARAADGGSWRGCDGGGVGGALTTSPSSPTWARAEAGVVEPGHAARHGVAQGVRARLKI